MKNYGVLKGSAIGYKRDSDDTPHSEVHLQADGVDYRIAINVRSSRGPQYRRLIEYLIVHDFSHPTLDHARQLPLGWNDLTDGVNDEAALDYIRSNAFRAADMQPVVHLQPGEDNDLFEYIEALIDRAIRDDNAMVYAFGEHWGPEEKPDGYFSFSPGNGVHLIHMNQGGSGEHNGTYRDGALYIDFPARGKAVALFLKFQNQIWHTDDTDATPIENAPRVADVAIPDAGPAEAWPVIAADSPYHLARIIAAMVNPEGQDPAHEFITILNISASPLDLANWRIVDRNGNFDTLSGSVAPGETSIVRLTGKGAQLSNKGGTITLLDDRGLKVDGVAYTKSQVEQQGLAALFV